MRFANCKSCGGPVSRTSRTQQCRQCYVKPLPDDFAARARTMRRFELMRHYGVSDMLIARWAKEAGVKPVERVQMAVPDDFAELAPTMGVMQLRRHYGRAERIIRRWLKETCLKALASPPRPRSDYRPRVQREQTARSQPFVWKGQRTPRVPPRDSSLHGSAAEHLRRYAAVYRCSERGSADQEGEFYRYGTAILNPDELLMRAQRHGWQAAP